MKKILFISLIMIMLSGCAVLAPETKPDLSMAKQADLALLRDGKIALPQAVVLEAVSDVLSARGFIIESAAGSAVSTQRKHGVTFYGSMDYSLSCAVTEAGGVSNLSWTVNSYITDYLTKTDTLSADASGKWNTVVFSRLIEKNAVAVEPRQEETGIMSEGKSSVPVTPADLTEDSLPRPPTAE